MGAKEANKRRVGVEVEFGGIGLVAAVDVVAAGLEAKVTAVSEHEYLLSSALHADPFRLEVDFRLLQEMSRDEAEDPNAIRRTAVDVLGAAASLLTPLELVSPPLEFDQIDDVERVLDALAAAGAVGTQDSIAYAFGTHFNPSVVDFEPASLLRHLQAFLCLTAWLKARDQIDLTRRITSFANPFPKSYELKVLPSGYDPALPALIDDYLADNPTRNRALDLLPLFSFLDDERVGRVVDDELVKARPTFHYRMPNSRLGDPDWTIRRPWEDWLTVERLAARPAALRSLCDERLQRLQQWALLEREADWVERCDAVVAGLE
ncbi:MAG: amidoligase family protein [Pseudomonadota bacterium]